MKLVNLDSLAVYWDCGGASVDNANVRDTVACASKKADFPHRT